MYEAYKRLLQNIKQKTGRKLIVWRIVKIRRQTNFYSLTSNHLEI